MKRRRAEQRERREWQDWLKQRYFSAEESGLPDAVFATEGHWRYFLDHGTLPSISRQPGFLLRQLDPEQLERLSWFIWRNAPEAAVLREMHRWLNPGSTPADVPASGGVGMTERAWLTSSQPERMLAELNGRANERQLRLFACACCRRLEPVPLDRRSRHALDVIERYADGVGSRADVEASLDAAANAELGARGPARAAARAVVAAWSMPEHARSAAAHATGQPDREGSTQADLLREIVGNPHRAPVVDLDWLDRNDGCVRRIAEAIRAEGRFADLPILADALEEAGCTNAPLLAHCRRPRGHVRGCWALDALAGAPVFERLLIPGVRAWTVGRAVEREAIYKRLTCAGSYARLTLRVEPMDVNAPVGILNAVPWLAGVGDGVQQVVQAQADAGRRLRGIRVALLDFAAHPIDSSHRAFAQASARAFTAALDEAGLVPCAVE